MVSRTVRRVMVGAACALPVLAGVPAVSHTSAEDRQQARHVLLISVDGLHQTDVAWYVAHHPDSGLAGLVAQGVEFTNARTPVISDSFPGLMAQVTGGNPSSTGVYYDDSYNQALLPAGTTNCSTAPPGVEVTYFEAADRDPHALDAGQGLSGLPGSILSMTGNPTTLLDPRQLPVDPASCTPVYPHQYLKVNTIFEVARAAHLRTAWADKHPAYEILNGPSGTGVQDLFTPEINSDAPTAGSSIDWTKDNLLTRRYDTYKADAVVNEIRGFDHSGMTRLGTPAIFGMNFQSVSTAEKLPASQGQAGGYLADGVTPGPVLRGALDYVNGQLARFRDALEDRGLARNTTIVLSAKHGQSPDTPSQLTRIPDSPIIAAINNQWTAAHPGFTSALIAQATDDDAMLLWLDHGALAANHLTVQEAADFVKSRLLAGNGTGNDITGAPRAYTRSGLRTVYAGTAAADFLHVAHGDARVPDILGVAQVGTVFTGGKGKIAEHGGLNPQDRDVPLIVSGGPADARKVVSDTVETTQIAPTILRLLGLDPQKLRAVRLEHTAALPVGGDGHGGDGQD